MSKGRPSMRDVAEAANVSVSAVSIVARNKPGVSAETRERIRAAMSALGYTPSIERGNGKTGTIGLLIEKGSIPVIVDVFYGDIIRGLQSEARRLGYRTMLHMYDRSAESPDRLGAELEGEVQGLIIANDGDITPDMVVQLEALNLPLVLVESYVPGEQLPCVLGDNFVAGYTVAKQLLSLGHRSLAVLPGPPKYSSLMDRLRGSLAVVAEAGLSIPPEFMPAPVSGHPQKGYLQMQEVLHLPHRPTGVVAVSDKTAFGAMEAIKEVGLRIPEDVAMVSIDDVLESAYTQPPLTTYRIPRYDMGVLAMQKLHRLMSDEPEMAVKSVVYGELIVRESSGGHLDRGMSKSESIA